MNNDNKYMIFVKARQGVFMVAAGPTVNGLLTQIGDWLDKAGKYVSDDELIDVEVRELDKLGGIVNYERLPVDKRTGIIKAAKQLGAR